MSAARPKRTVDRYIAMKMMILSLDFVDGEDLSKRLG